MSKLWLASLMACGALVLGCQSGGKKDCCCCSGAVSKQAEEDDDGKEETIAADELPAPVMNAFKKSFPGVTIVKAEKETYADGTVHYEIEYKGKDGKEQEVELNSEGEVLEDH